MATLVDFNGSMLAAIAVAGTDELGFIRHITLNSVRATRKRFRPKYGELVLCCDGPNSWRKQHFQYYKAARKAAKEASPIDWHKIFDAMNTIKKELRDFFPYPQVEIEGAEGDDVISVYARKYPGPHMIVSNDKDMLQLQKIKGVENWAPVKAKMLVPEKNIDVLLKEHIICGDGSDGIPNCMSDDDTFVIPGKRQVPMRQKRLQELLQTDFTELNPDLDPELLQRYRRNEKVISLFEIPADLEQKIQSEIENEMLRVNGQRSDLLDFFISRNLRNLVDKIEDF